MLTSISLTALALLLIFVTPALILLILYRFFFPKTRTIKVSDTIVLLVAIIANLLMNGALLSSYLHDLISNKEVIAAIPSDYRAIIQYLFKSGNQHSVFQPSEYLLDTSSSNFLNMVFDLHIRSLIFGVIIFVLIKFVGILEEYLQYIPYKKNEPTFANCVDRFLLWSFGFELNHGSSDETYERKKIAITAFGFAPLKWCRDAVYHPWAHLTKTNRKREILMVDVLTTEGSLYSGTFTTWVPSVDSISEIAMEYAIRFYPRNSTNQRKKTLIKNNGELIIARERIETIHFWEIRKNACITVVVKEAQDIESTKWFILLAYVYPSFFKQITVQVKLKDPEWLKFKSDMIEWQKESRIKFNRKLDDIEIRIVKVNVP